MGEGCTCFDPENIMCSNRCANPLFPGVWLAAPTWYQTSTAICGRRWASLRVTVSPFGSWDFWNLISGSDARAANTSARNDIAAIRRIWNLRQPGTALACVAGGRKARIRVLRIAGDFLAQPGRAVEPLPFVGELDLRQPEIALAEVVQVES